MMYVPLAIFLAGVGWLIWKGFKEKAEYDEQEANRMLAARRREEAATAYSGNFPQGQSQSQTKNIPSSQFGPGSQGSERLWKM